MFERNSEIHLAEVLVGAFREQKKTTFRFKLQGIVSINCYVLVFVVW